MACLNRLAALVHTSLREYTKVAQNSWLVSAKHHERCNKQLN